MKDINLLPHDMKNSTYDGVERKAGVSAKAVIITILVLLVFGVTLFIPQLYVINLEAELDGLKADIASPEYQEVKVVNRDLNNINKLLSNKSDIINDIDNTNISVNELMTSIISATPEGCELYSIMLTGQKVDISGTASDNIVVAEMVSNLSRLKNVRMTGSANIRDDKSFTISMQLLGKAGV